MSFVSKGFEGQASDVYLTERCGYLDRLLPGDVMPGKGLNSTESVSLRSNYLNLQAFMKGKQQLNTFELDDTKCA